MSLRVKLWGVRGSIPSPYDPQSLNQQFTNILESFSQSKKSAADFLAGLHPTTLGGFGGNTTCIEVQSTKQNIIIDGGSGIRRLGLSLLAGPCGKGQGEVHIYFTHFHWDHLIGLPFFIPVFIPGNKIHLYSVQDDLEKTMRLLFQKPYFPVPYERLGAQFIYHKLEPRSTSTVGDIKTTPYKLDHPDPCWGFKFECNGKTYSHCVDTEATRVTREDLGADLPLYQNVDLMVFDAQYTLAEIIDKTDWGHAAAPLGLEIAMREGIKKVIFMHHDPFASDEKIREAEAQTRKFYDLAIKNQKHLKPVDWAFAIENSLIEV